MNVFQYSPAILARYPNVVGGAIFVQGIPNGPTPESLQAQFQAEQQATLQRIGNTPLSQISFAGGMAQYLSRLWRRPHAVPQRSRSVVAPPDQKRRHSQHQCPG